MRPLVLVLCCSLALSVAGQKKQDALTSDFSKLSAKERARIAKEEQDGAQKDAAYQQVMTEADALFQQQLYDEALVKYEEGRNMRPYNVYPKVKIEDLQVLLKQRAEAAATARPDTVEAAPPQVELPKTDPVIPPPPDTTAKRPRPSATVPPLPEKRVVHETPAVHTTPERQVDRRTIPDDSQERRYEQGTAHVIERTVTRDGVTTVFKRVQYNWGGSYYFQDGTSIDERVWKEFFHE